MALAKILQRSKKDGTLVGEKLSFLSYNIWFAEEFAMSQRMAAISEMIARYRPSFLALQEVTRSLSHVCSAVGTATCISNQTARRTSAA